MRQKIDLHTHSAASDGVYSPSALIDHAIHQGLRAMAITDHDTVGGLAEAIDYAGSAGFMLVPGIEFSVEYPSGSFHLVGLYIDPANKELSETSERLKTFRETRAARIIEDLKRHGVDIPLEEVVQIASGAPLGKPHFARVMIRHGYARSMEEIFRNFMVSGKPGDVPKEKIALDKAIALIHNAGGVAVIAHPVSLEFSSFEEFDGMLPAMKELGLDGIEAYAYMHTGDQVDELLRIGRKNRLLITGGSDFHSDGDIQLGCYGDGKDIPANLLDELLDYRTKKTG